MTKDFYFVLGVKRGATPEEIRSAYRRRALELHPDKSGCGSEPFVELQEAYSVLSDPAQRSAYDRSEECVPIRREEAIPTRRRSAEAFREVEPDSFREVTFAPSFDEMFDRLWSNFDLLTRPKPERLEGLEVEVALSAEEALASGSARISGSGAGDLPGLPGPR